MNSGRSDSKTNVFTAVSVASLMGKFSAVTTQDLTEAWKVTGQREQCFVLGTGAELGSFLCCGWYQEAPVGWEEGSECVG